MKTTQKQTKSKQSEQPLLPRTNGWQGYGGTVLLALLAPPADFVVGLQLVWVLTVEECCSVISLSGIVLPPWESAKCELKGKSEIFCWKKKKDKNFKVEMSVDDSFCCCYLCYLLWLCFQTHSQLYWLMYQRYTFLTTWWRCSPMIWRLNWLWSAEASFVFTVLIRVSLC